MRPIYAMLILCLLALCLLAGIQAERIANQPEPKPSPVVAPTGLNIDPTYIWVEPIPARQAAQPFVCWQYPAAPLAPEQFQRCHIGRI